PVPYTTLFRSELPPGRTPVVTRLLPESRREELVERVAAAAREGRQVYWVCPLIDDAADPGVQAGGGGDAGPSRAGARAPGRRQRGAPELQTATATRRPPSRALAARRVGHARGRLGAAGRQAVRDGVAGGEIAVLVATTVIEVGVDVPNASLMVIEHAERFGRGQLHQLRGRVGRGSTRSACVLMYRSPLTPAARSRLRIMQE